MSTIVPCTCGSIGADPNAVRQCSEHFRIFRGDKRLASVGSVIRDTWPIKKNFEDAAPAVLENARDRGVVCDELFSAWLNGTLISIPAGTRADAVGRFIAVQEWWVHEFGDAPARAQVLLADHEIAGTVDIVVDWVDPPSHLIIDMKNVSAIDPTYHLQLGGYAELYEAQYDVPVAGIGILHVTQPKDKPVSVKYVDVPVELALKDWRALREMWQVVRRRTVYFNSDEGGLKCQEPH